MPTFMSSLAANPGGGGVYGQPDQGQQYSETLSLFNQIRNRDMADFQTKAQFMADLSLKQDRLKRLFDVQDQQREQGSGPGFDVRANPQGGQQNVVMGQPLISEYQKGELGIRQQGVDVEKAKLSQQGSLGEEALGIKSAQEQLNQQKSDQINAQKTADMQRKVEESNQKIQLANDKLKQAGDDFQKRLDAQKDLATAVEERHKAEMDQKQTQFDIVNAQHKQAMSAMQKKLDQSAHTKTTTTVNPEGTERTTETTRGSTVQGIGRDGQTYDVPIDQIDDWNANHAKAGTEIESPQGPDEGHP
jgi:hypothetical protein